MPCDDGRVESGSLWAATMPRRPPRDGAPARRRHRRRRGDHRRRLHRAVDGAVPRRGRPGAARRRARSASTSASAPAGATAGGARRCWRRGSTALAGRHGRDAAIAMKRAMHATVDEVGTVLAGEGDDAGYCKGGTISLARTPAQELRLAAAHRGGPLVRPRPRRPARGWVADEVGGRCQATLARAAVFTPHCAAVHPLRLVHAVAAAALRRGVRIHEQTAALAIEPRRVTTDTRRRARRRRRAGDRGVHRRAPRAPPRRASRCTR